MRNRVRVMCTPGSVGGATRSYGCTCYDWSYDQDVTQCATTDTLPRRAAGGNLAVRSSWDNVTSPTQGGRASRERARRLLDVRFVIQPPASTALDKPRGLWDLVDVVTENNLIRAIVTWMSPMPFPFAETVALTDLHRAQLESLVRASSTPQALVFRCRLILRAADRDHPTNLQIAAEFDCNRHTVAGWRNRYLSNGLAGLQDAPRSGRPRRFSPSERLDLINLASSTTEQQGCPATRWSLDDLAATLINRTAHDLAMSRSTIWRILDEADLKPHRSVYWLNSHDPDFDAKAQEICKLY